MAFRKLAYFIKENKLYRDQNLHVLGSQNGTKLLRNFDCDLWVEESFLSWSQNTQTTKTMTNQTNVFFVMEEKRVG